MKLRVGINGMGRIGRMILRAIIENNFKNIEIKHINNRTSSETCSTLLKYDSIHGKFNAELGYDDDHLIINKNKISFSQETDLKNINWKKHSVDYVFECTGKFNSKDKLETHLKNGAKKVIVSAPCKDADKIIVFGVNETECKKEDKIISAASCTTNCLAPVAQIINETFERNSNPILVGGTGLYVHTLINGLIDIPAIPESIKNESEKIIKEFGKDFLINQIQKFDPMSLKEVNSNDTVRLRRIWEVYESTGKKFSEWKLNENKKFLENYHFKIILFLPNREKNYQIVNSRFIKMINNGAIEEVKNLLDLNLNDSLPVMRAHGVPEIIKFLRNEISLEECISKGQQVTRNYVKRQHTWWNSSNLDIFHQFDKFPIEIDINSIKID